MIWTQPGQIFCAFAERKIGINLHLHLFLRNTSSYNCFFSLQGHLCFVRTPQRKTLNANLSLLLSVGPLSKLPVSNGYLSNSPMHTLVNVFLPSLVNLYSEITRNPVKQTIPVMLPLHSCSLILRKFLATKRFASSKSKKSQEKLLLVSVAHLYILLRSPKDTINFRLFTFREQ